jgi:hypothetical protein
MITWEEVYNKLKEKIINIIGDKERLESDINFDKLLIETIKELMMKENVFKVKEVGRDTYRNIPGKQVIYNKDSKLISIKEVLF